MRLTKIWKYAFINLPFVVAFSLFVFFTTEKDGLRGNLAGRVEVVKVLPASTEPSLNTFVCNDGVFLVTMVISHFGHFHERYLIRKTWGGVKRVHDIDIRTVFLLGKDREHHPGTVRHRNQQTVLEKVRKENALHGDIIVLDLVDHYLNLTLKTLQGLNIITNNCSSAEYVLKVDDDVFINYDLLVKHISYSARENFVIGYLHENARPIRSAQSPEYAKWFTPITTYNRTYYPPYLIGPAYVMSHDVAKAIVQISPQVPFLPWEDVFITGLCLEKLKMTPKMDKRFDTNGEQFKQNVSCPINRLFAIHNHGSLSQVWTLFRNENRDTHCKDRTLAFEQAGNSE
ncbi:beta-1,3-galactosyltransferase 5-like [Saccoglossus kowalevskii]|uniref:Hexosyltransferase n=1 Tax=Saccoglossus kowalevskii TaxID=10224 RepID=A0ABM0MNI6_SACKO|nr:PREDICTED: beta-1,3-galactosyltransferase 1-like [Saccoglossus kowalevskii]